LQVLSDRSTGAGPGPSQHAPLLGDLLVILGAGLYAVCNVTQEKLLGEVAVVELLAFLGCFGALFSGLQVALLERRALQSFALSAASVQPFLGFALSLYAFYLLVPKVLVGGGATVLNLSLLTSDLWSAVARVLFFGGFGSSLWAFVVSLVLVAAGLSIYTLAGPVKASGAEAPSYQAVPNSPECELSSSEAAGVSQEISALAV
jgi:solute carrier family 35 protein F1/2